jgi:hypothetical protein
MSLILENIAATFGVSEPIFKAELMYNGDQVEFSLKNPYRPNVQELLDPVAKILAHEYRESLDRRNKCFKHEISFESAYGRISNKMIEFYVEFSPLKNPKQSKLYKWLCTVNGRYNHPSNEGFIALFRYIHGHKLSMIGNKDNGHVKNVLAILEMMKEKYEDKQ